jgi:hypothetical protein
MSDQLCVTQWENFLESHLAEHDNQQPSWEAVEKGFCLSVRVDLHAWQGDGNHPVAQSSPQAVQQGFFEA